MMHLQVNDSQFQRFCGHCGQPIPLERLLKAITSRAKVFFCSDQCRFADANAKNRAARELRLGNPNRLPCSLCGGRGYTRVKRHQHGRNEQVTAQSESRM